MTKKKIARARPIHRGIGSSGRSDCSSSSSNPGPTTPPTNITGQPTPPTPTGNKMTHHHMRRSFPAPGGPITTLHQAAASSGSTPCNGLQESGQSTPASVTGSSLSAHAVAWYPPGHRVPATAPTSTTTSIAVVFPASPIVSAERYPASVGVISPHSEPNSFPARGTPQTHPENHLHGGQDDSNSNNKARPSWHSESHDEDDEGEDVVYQFVPVSDCVAANEDQLIGAMAGAGISYWQKPPETGDTDVEPANETGSDDWVDPHGHVYDNRTPPETHHLSSLDVRGRSRDNVNMTPMSFLADDPQWGDEEDDDELYDSEMEWVEQELQRHAATHADDPTLFW